MRTHTHHRVHCVFSTRREMRTSRSAAESKKIRTLLGENARLRRELCEVTTNLLTLVEYINKVYPERR